MPGPFAAAAIAETAALLPDWLELYPAATRASFNVVWSAINEDYDGAPDSGPASTISGHGDTRFEAYAELSERTAELVS